MYKKKNFESKKLDFHATLIKLSVLYANTFQAPIERIENMKERKSYLFTSVSKITFLWVTCFPLFLRDFDNDSIMCILIMYLKGCASVDCCNISNFIYLTSLRIKFDEIKKKKLSYQQFQGTNKKFYFTNIHLFNSMLFSSC